MTKKIKLEDMSTSEMQPKSKNLLLEGLQPDLTQFVVQPSPSNSMMVMVNTGRHLKEGSPKLIDTSISDIEHRAKRARIESILGQVALNSANESAGNSARSLKSKSESPKLDGTKQQKVKEGASLLVNNENSLGSQCGSPASQESLEADQSEDHSAITQSQVSSLDTLSQESISESPVSTD